MRRTDAPILRRAIFEHAQAALLLAQIFHLQRPGPLEAACVDERYDLVQLAGIQVGAVAAADVDHRP